MNRRDFIKTALAASAAEPAFGKGGGAHASSRPNFIIILADDLGYGELGCYGNSFNETPHLDALAEKGVLFTDAYSSAPVCSPTRAALLAGQWPHQSGITDYLRPNAEIHIPDEKELLPEALKAAGYATELIGKWHLTGYQLPAGYPQRHGFDHVAVSEKKGIGAGDYFYPYRFNPDIDKRLPGKEHLVDRVNLEAVDFIEQNRTRPFFLLVSHYAIHTLLQGRRDLVRKYKMKPNGGRTRFSPKNNPHLAAQLEAVDHGVGMTIKTLDDAGILDNTVIIFASDNGGEAGVANNGPLRAGKSHLYEGGIRVPMIAWAGSAVAGKACTTPVSTIDLFPTIMDMAGLDHGLPLEGDSFLPDMIKWDYHPPDRELYWHYPLDKPHFLGGRSSAAVRSGNWKLIEFYDTGELELYDLERDVGESENLIKSEPQVAGRLHERLSEWRVETGAV